MADTLMSFSFILVFLCLEALFSGGEIALVAADINKIRNKARAGSRSALMTLRLLNNPEWFLSTTLTGTNICVVTNTALATSMFISMFGSVHGELVSILVMIPLLLIMGEIVPKSIFQQYPEPIALKISWFIWTASMIFYPIVFIVSRISRGALYVFSQEKKPYYMPYITKAGLEFILQKEGDQSDIMTSEKEMIQRIFDFTDSTADDIMVPLSNVIALPSNTILKEASRIITDKGYSRIPVYEESVFNIIGILHTFDLLDVLYGETVTTVSLSENDPIETCIRRDVLYVPETKPTDELLVELQKRGEHMAIVVDEYGGGVGIVTIEDILEEIVGEIDDEYSSDNQTLYKKVAPGKYLFNAQVKLDYVREIIVSEIPEGDYETLGGFLLTMMGKIPKSNEAFRYGEIIFIIKDADMKSIKDVLVVVPEGSDKSK